MLAFPCICCDDCKAGGGRFLVSTFWPCPLGPDRFEDSRCVLIGSGFLQNKHILWSPEFKQKQLGQDSAAALSRMEGSWITLLDSTGTFGLGRLDDFNGTVHEGWPKQHKTGKRLSM